MTNLFIPALAVYLQKKFPPLQPPSSPSHNTHRLPAHGQSTPSRRVEKEHPLSLLSTPVLDSFFPYPPPLLPRLTWAGWWGRDTGQQDHEGWAVTRLSPSEADELGNEEEVRIMRIGWADVGNVLDRNLAEAEHRAWTERDHVLLRLVRDMAEDWESNHSSTRASCIRELAPGSQGTASPSGSCHIISPYPGPENDTMTPLGFLSSSSDLSFTNGTEALDIVPVGWAQNAGNVYHSVAALFRVPRSCSLAFEDSWLAAIGELTTDVNGEVFVEAQGPKGGVGDQTGKWLLSVSDFGSYSLVNTVDPYIGFVVRTRSRFHVA